MAVVDSRTYTLSSTRTLRVTIFKRAFYLGQTYIQQIFSVISISNATISFSGDLWPLMFLVSGVVVACCQWWWASRGCQSTIPNNQVCLKLGQYLNDTEGAKKVQYNVVVDLPPRSSADSCCLSLCSLVEYQQKIQDFSGGPLAKTAAFVGSSGQLHTSSWTN